ncbi:hypothetical protein [Paraliomyxa miuraensis]|uniref:hypothetical protein n=1 Tax=Paraliomyxa miuraensis TaxID=376150 RepID=UPI002252D930|nr:hypothetical protein [Paraliomyxa miuraensis]MCX4242494.1 hypothetical protein [Paraliomyxa miuraensis]
MKAWMLAMALLMGCAPAVVSLEGAPARSRRKTAHARPARMGGAVRPSSNAPRCPADAPCPVQVSVSIELPPTATVTSVALAADHTGYVGTRGWPSRTDPTAGGRGQVIEIGAQGLARAHDDVLPGSILRTDAAGQPVVISRPWAMVLQERGWLDGSHPRTLGTWPRRVLDVDVRGVERLESFDARVGPRGVVALLSSRQTFGQFPLLLARSTDDGGWTVDALDPRPARGLAAFDLTPDGRPFAVWVAQSTDPTGVAIVAGFVGSDPVTVVGPPSAAAAAVSVIDVLAPTDGQPALVSLAIGNELHLARLAPDGPMLREVVAARGTEHDPQRSYPLGTTHEEVTGVPEHHLLLRTGHRARLAWIGQHVERVHHCREEVTEVGPIVACNDEHAESSSRIHVVGLDDDLQPVDPLVVDLAPAQVHRMVGAARPDAVALAVLRGVDADRAALDYVVLSMRD